MKHILTLIFVCTLALNLIAQTDTTAVKVLKKNVVTVVDDNDKVHVKLGEDRGIEVITDDWGDTTHVRIGRRTFKVIDGNNGTYVKVVKESNWQRWSGKFNPHWAGLEVGVNAITNSDYSLYEQSVQNEYGDFMDLNPGKSLTWNLNFAEFAFTNEKKNFGVVTGLGLSFNDYAFDNSSLTIVKDNQSDLIIPDWIADSDGDGNTVKKSKLHVNYLTAPLMIEIKTPLRMGSSRLYLAGGVIGSLYLGSHTKYKYEDGDKEKSKTGYNINPFKYELTGRIGFGDFCVFTNYSMTSLFKDGNGPEVHPLLIGISFPNI